MERPNTIAGLQFKRTELAKLHKHLTTEAKNVLCDLDHIDATIRLFDPDADIERVRLKRYTTKHRAPQGQMKRFVLTMFRESAEPLTSRQITEAWVADRGLSPDESTYIILRKRVGACMTALQAADMIEGKHNVVVAHAHCFAQLVAHDKRGLVLNVQIARHFQGANAFRSVYEKCDSGKNVGEVQLTAGEDRAGRDAELLMATATFPLAAGGDEIRLNAATCGAVGFTVVVGKADSHELFPSLLFAHFEDVFDLQGAGGGGEKEVCLAWHDLLSPLSIY